MQKTWQTSMDVHLHYADRIAYRFEIRLGHGDKTLSIACYTILVDFCIRISFMDNMAFLYQATIE